MCHNSLWSTHAIRFLIAKPLLLFFLIFFLHAQNFINFSIQNKQKEANFSWCHFWLNSNFMLLWVSNIYHCWNDHVDCVLWSLPSKLRRKNFTFSSFSSEIITLNSHNVSSSWHFWLSWSDKKCFFFKYKSTYSHAKLHSSLGLWYFLTNLWHLWCWFLLLFTFHFFLLWIVIKEVYEYFHGMQK